MQAVLMMILQVVKSKYFWYAVIGIVAFFIVKKLFKKTDTPWKNSEEGKDQQTSNKAVDSEIKNEQKSGMKQSYSDANYKVFAESIFSDMNGCGTNDEGILATFGKMKNRLDILKLIDAFGVRTISCMGIKEEGTLAELLKMELSQDSINTLNFAAKTQKINFQI